VKPPDTGNVVNLMDALRKSLSDAGKRPKAGRRARARAKPRPKAAPRKPNARLVSARPDSPGRINVQKKRVLF
jgi:hypothetical protein